jgi:hypothetical protein
MLPQPASRGQPDGRHEQPGLSRATRERLHQLAIAATAVATAATRTFATTGLPFAGVLVFVFHVVTLLAAALAFLALLALLATTLTLLTLLAPVALLLIALTAFIVVAVFHTTATLVATLGILVVCHCPAPVDDGQTLCPSLSEEIATRYSA